MDEDEIDSLHGYLHGLGKSLNTRFDLLYDTLEGFNASRDTVGSVEYDAYREGVCIYAKA
jgi:hypothetical protein